jgi:hypothetical protein
VLGEQGRGGPQLLVVVEAGIVVVAGQRALHERLGDALAAELGAQGEAAALVAAAAHVGLGVGAVVQQPQLLEPRDGLGAQRGVQPAARSRSASSLAVYAWRPSSHRA